MSFSFTKMHGLGNDFVVLDGTRTPIALTPKQVRAMANRRTGIGCDQVLVIHPTKQPDADFYYQIFNADGSQVGQCGNGARCLGRYIMNNQLTTKNKIILHTDTSRLELLLNNNGDITVKLAVPIFQPSKIPFVSQHQAKTYQLPILGDDIDALTCTILSLGNPHAVICVDDLASIDVDRIGKAFNQSPLFPEGVNVGLMQVISKKHINCRIYERGVGETQACGSGACAGVVAGCMLGLLEEEVLVSLLGGELVIKWQGEGHPVWMSGPAVCVFTGNYCAC